MIIESLSKTPEFGRLVENLPAGGEERSLTGLAGSSPIALAAALAETGTVPCVLVVVPTPNDAEAAEADLDALRDGLGRGFPQRESVHPGLDDPHIEIAARRVEALQALTSGRARVLVTTGRAISERFVVPSSWLDLEIRLSRGAEVRLEELVEVLERSGYRSVPMVESVGEYAVRGGIVDVYGITTLDPIRIELWGDRIESLREFDVLDQRSTRTLESTRVLPIRFPRAEPLEDGPQDAESRVRSLLEIVPEPTLVVRLDPAAEENARRRSWEELSRRTETPENYQLTPESVDARLRGFRRLRLEPATTAGGATDLDFRIRPPQPIERRIDRLLAALRDADRQGARVLVLCDNDGQIQRLEEILDEAADPKIVRRVTFGLRPLARGFLITTSDPQLWLFTDHEIFLRERRPREQPRVASRAALESISSLAPGDYVVHVDHGIGRFRNLERVRVAGEEIETLVIEYAGGEILRVPHYRADLIERWKVGSDPEESDGAPRLHRLGGKGWQRLKKRTRDAIQTMTAELLELYADRRVARGRAFSPDTRWQREMESAFLFDDTPDQERVTAEVKHDMELTRPMDRLICGDVGYGKTEIAIRAAFKAVQDGAQVAVLAPTTVLVEQHLQTFRARLADFPVHVEALSRFRTSAEQRRVLAGLVDGSVDIVIGTHRVLSADVDFKRLGLLVVDEEQRFGVTQKERLKALKRSVDVLTMTATPIPRTLHMSLSGLRDLSLIRTPPRNRRPVITHVMTWNDQMIEDAIRLEVDRGGQVFFVHNRVESIDAVAARVRRLVPDSRVEVGHGQMSERELEDVMTDFVRGDIQVLVATAIVENGLDVPNANTMIVSRADLFGLAQLYQLRGRVGRSHQRAYCYLLRPANLPPETERRLQLLEQHTELGAGYRLALKDLELRGAGNLLGSEQSGFAQAMGFDMYLRLLEETVNAMKDGPPGGRRATASAPEVSVAGATYIPDGFIPDESQKLHFYRRLSRVADPEDLAELADELRDRFGPLPPEAGRLVASARIRILGQRLGVERVLCGTDSARLNFRRGVVPRLAALRDGLADRHIEVDVRRLQPLSLVIRQPDANDVSPTVIESLERLLQDQREPVPTS